MNKQELIKELEELRDIKDYSTSKLMNTGYRTAILDSIDLVKNLSLFGVSQQRKLLVDFWMNLPKTNKHKGVAEHYVDKYLKSTNCG